MHPVKWVKRGEGRSTSSESLQEFQQPAPHHLTTSLPHPPPPLFPHPPPLSATPIPSRLRFHQDVAILLPAACRPWPSQETSATTTTPQSIPPEMCGSTVWESTHGVQWWTEGPFHIHMQWSIVGPFHTHMQWSPVGPFLRID